MILQDIRDGRPADEAICAIPSRKAGFIGKNALCNGLSSAGGRRRMELGPAFLRRIRMKPSRTLSGVTTVTVLTKPYPCPGKCVFCPTDQRMPKSYLPDEPGAMRAVQNEFDPFDQTASRIEALYSIGHPTAKIELLILGGTWSSYRRDYQAWFVQRCLDAMNGFDSTDLAEAQAANARADPSQCGPGGRDPPRPRGRRRNRLVEIAGRDQGSDGRPELGRSDSGPQPARPHASKPHARRCACCGCRLRRSSCTGCPTSWVRALESDVADFARLWVDSDLRPDELKIYPNQLLEQAELFTIWQQGGYQPYTTKEFIELLVQIKPTIPRYCRVNRIIRDFPSTHVVEGNRRTSLRQDVHIELQRRGLKCNCIRCREIRGRSVSAGALRLEDETYAAGGAEEHFLSFVTPDDHLAGFLRLSLPGVDLPQLGYERSELGGADPRSPRLWPIALGWGGPGGGLPSTLVWAGGWSTTPRAWQERRVSPG